MTSWELTKALIMKDVYECLIGLSACLFVVSVAYVLILYEEWRQKRRRRSGR